MTAWSIKIALLAECGILLPKLFTLPQVLSGFWRESVELPRLRQGGLNSHKSR